MLGGKKNTRADWTDDGQRDGEREKVREDLNGKQSVGGLILAKKKNISVCHKRCWYNF